MKHCENNPSLGAKVNSNKIQVQDIMRKSFVTIITLADATQSDLARPGTRERDQLASFYNWNMELGFIRGVTREGLKIEICLFKLVYMSILSMYQC